MPQLDKVTYFSQFFWLCVFYLGFYLALVKYFLPRISRILKVRRIKSVSKDQTFSNEGIELAQEINSLYVNGFKAGRDYLGKSVNNTEKLLNDIIAQTNGQQLKSVDNQFIQSLESETFKYSQILSDFAGTGEINPTNKESVELGELFHDSVITVLFEDLSSYDYEFQESDNPPYLD